VGFHSEIVEFNRFVVEFTVKIAGFGFFHARAALKPGWPPISRGHPAMRPLVCPSESSNVQKGTRAHTARRSSPLSWDARQQGVSFR
jgi:hypothetical protein